MDKANYENLIKDNTKTFYYNIPELFNDTNALAVHLALSFVYRGSHVCEHMFVSKYELAYILTGKLPQTSKCRFDRTVLNRIDEGLEYLVEHNYIGILEQFNKFYVVVSTKSLFANGTGYYRVINLYDVQKIINQKDSVLCFDLLKFYLGLRFDINAESKFCAFSRKTMNHKYNLTFDTMSKYLDILEKIELIHTFSNNDKCYDKCLTPLHFYCEYDDIDIVKPRVIEYLDKINAVSKKSLSLDRRSVRQKYNWFCKGSKRYEDVSELKKLYKECVEYNRIFTAYAGSNAVNSTKILDLSVFDSHIDTLKNIKEELNHENN